MKIKKITKILIISIVIIVTIINIVIIIWNKKENAIFEDRCFVYGGYSYYSFGNDESDNAVIYLPIIDSKGIFSKMDVDMTEGELYGGSDKIKIDHFNLEGAGKNNVYNSYILCCSFTLKENSIMVFDTVHIDKVGSFDIGKVVVETIDTGNGESSDIGYSVTTDSSNTYFIYVGDIVKKTIIDNIEIRDEEKKIIEGNWIGNNEILGDGAVSDLECQLPEKNYLYLKPIVHYSCGTKEYVETAKVATAYKGEISKEEIREYIRSKIGE